MPYYILADKTRMIDYYNLDTISKIGVAGGVMLIILSILSIVWFIGEAIIG